MAITIFSVYSNKPDSRPVISTHINDIKEKTTIVTINTEKTEHIINYPIDINFATKEELCSLDGIGETLSDRIIEYRNQNYFYSVEDITKVNGIGQKFLTENKNKIFVDISKLPEITTTPINTTINPPIVTPESIKTTITTIQISETAKVSETTTVTTTIPIITETSETEKEIKRVNLNTATYEDLTSLPISPEVADQILGLRDKIGYFSSTEELYYIENVNRKIYIELLKYVYVE
ncbi:MAG: helix-hairpin-helix domain-containing protein [Oscillospiraceae bacterium]|nr:helix-hairpin-helix domain-containing protein [Oscillospiraceae bacterium]